MNIKTQWLPLSKMAALLGEGPDTVRAMVDGKKANVHEIESQIQTGAGRRVTTEYRVPLSSLDKNGTKKTDERSAVITALRGQLDEAQAEVDTLKKTTSEQRKQLADLTGAQASSAEKINQQEILIKAKNKAIEAFEEKVHQYESLKQAGDDLAAITKAKDTEIDILKRQIDGYSDDLEKAQRQLATVQGALDRAADELNEQTALTRDRDDVIEALRAELAQKGACVGFGEEHFTEWMGPSELAKLLAVHPSTILKKSTGNMSNDQMVERRGEEEGAYEYRALKAAVYNTSKRKPKAEIDGAPLIGPLGVLMPALNEHRRVICDRNAEAWDALWALKEEWAKVQ